MEEIYTAQIKGDSGMNKINDDLYQDRKEIHQRQRIVNVRGISPMAQERIKCPFCSELILRDAIKCRFCGEWFKTPDQDTAMGGLTKDSDINGRTQSSHVVKGNHSDFPSSQTNQQSNSKKISADESRGEENVDCHQEVKETPAVRIAKEIVPAEIAGLRSVRKVSPKRWFRGILLIFYLGIVAALILTEFSAQRILSEARSNENSSDPDAAFARYSAVQDIYPYTFASIKARQNLSRIVQSSEFELPKQSWLVAFEDLLGIELKKQDVYLLPLAVWPISGLMLLLVFLTRIRRIGIALLAFFFMILAVSGSVAQLAWYGLVPMQSMTEMIRQIMQEPENMYIASYILLIITVFMTLTATVPRINMHIAKMIEASARKQ